MVPNNLVGVRALVKRGAGRAGANASRERTREMSAAYTLALKSCQEAYLRAGQCTFSEYVRRPIKRKESAISPVHLACLQISPAGLIDAQGQLHVKVSQQVRLTAIGLTTGDTYQASGPLNSVVYDIGLNPTNMTVRADTIHNVATHLVGPGDDAKILLISNFTSRETLVEQPSLNWTGTCSVVYRSPDCSLLV